MKLYVKTAVFVISVILLAGGCSKKDTTWDMNVMAPLFETRLSLNDLNRKEITVDPSDSSYRLVFRETLYSSGALGALEIPDTSINTSFTLRRLKLSDRSITQKITLAQINPALILLNGTMQTIPGQDLTNINPQNIDASAFFETADLDSGYMDITLKNELPVNVAILEIELLNSIDNSLVASDTFYNLAPNTSQTGSVSLAGKKVNAALVAKVKRLKTDASSGPVLIDVLKGVEVQIGVRSLRPKAATAVFPNQTILEQDEGLTLDMGGPEVKYVKVKTGTLRIRIITTVEENMTMLFKIPSASKNGAIIDRIVKVPGGKPGSPTILNEDVDMAGYMIDYRGKNPDVTDTVNTFHQILKVTLDSSGRKVSIALSDSIRILYGLVDVVPEYAIGYLGNRVANTGPSSLPVTFLKGISGNVELQDLVMTVTARNGIGALGRFRMNNLTGANSQSGKKVSLSAAPLSGNIFLNPAIFNPFTPYETSLRMDKNNSNVAAFASNLPDRLEYDLEIETNPYGNSSKWKDFAYFDSKAEVFLDAELPVSTKIGGLNLKDTQRINFLSVKNQERAKSAKIRLFAENTFPYHARIQAYLLDSRGQFLDSVMLQGKDIAWAGIPNAAGRVTTPVSSILEAAVPPNKMASLRAASSIVISGTLTQPSGTDFLKIYSDYYLKVKSSVVLEYEAGY